MDLDLDRTTVGYVAAALAVLAAVAFGLRPVFFELSLTVRAITLLAAFLILLAIALHTGWSIDLLVLAAFAGFVGYVLTTWPLGALAVLGALVAVMVVAGLGYVLHENRFRWSRRRAQFVVVAALVLTTAMVGVDLSTGEVTYDRTVRDRAEVFPDQGRQMVIVGHATASTGSPFREPVTFPDARACVYTAASDTSPSVFFRGPDGGAAPGSVAPFGSVTARMVVPLSEGQVAAAGESIPIEFADSCPDAAAVDGARIVVTDE